MINNGGPSQEQDIIFVDRIEEETLRSAAPAADAHADMRSDNGRAIVGMTGQYTLKSWRDADGNPRVFACSVLKITPKTIVLAAPVKGAIGEWVNVHFGTLGKFEGPIVKIAQRSFVMRIVATADEASSLAGKIAWVENGTAANGRRHTRFVPLESRSTVRLANGTVVPCEIIDYTASGTAVSAEFDLDLGVVVKVGKVFGRVVRKFAGGFAIEFASLQDDRAIEQLITHNA